MSKSKAARLMSICLFIHLALFINLKTHPSTLSSLPLLPNRLTSMMSDNLPSFRPCAERANVAVGGFFIISSNASSHLLSIVTIPLRQSVAGKVRKCGPSHQTLFCKRAFPRIPLDGMSAGLRNPGQNLHWSLEEILKIY